MALVIIAGEIDLSVESMAGLSCAVIGLLWSAKVSVELAIPIVLVIGALGGLFNGLLVTRLGLPSLVVTLGTLALYRGLALIVLGPNGVSGFPDWFTSFGFGTIPGTPIPWPLLIFVGLAIVLGYVLHLTWPGRQLFALGKNPSAARYSGVRVARVKLALFCLNGVIAALAGVILTARFASSRADIGQGMTLTVVTIVLLGGVSIFGGRGTIPGVVLAAAVLAVLGNVLRLTNISAEIQSIATGVLLIGSVVIPNLAHRFVAQFGSGPKVGRGSTATASVGGISSS
jgi:rhamnose transport system permease protein